MTPIPLKKTFLAILVLGGLGALAWATWGRASDPPPPLENLSELVYTRVAKDVAERVVLPREDRAVLVPPIANDTRDAFRARLREELRQRGAEVLSPANEAPAWLGELQEKDDSWWDRIDAFFARDDQEKTSVKLAARLEFTDDDDRVGLVVDWAEWDKERKALVEQGQSKDEIPKSWFSSEYAQYRIHGSSRLLRLVFWMLLVIVPSIASTPLIRRVLREQSNTSNATLVLVLALPGAFGGWLLTAFAAGWVGTLITFLAVAVSLMFSYLYCLLLEARR